MQPKFRLGKITVNDEAVIALERSGQDAEFFLTKHASGDCGEEDPALNDLQKAVVSKYHTLRGHELYVMTNLEKGETTVFCPPNSVIRYQPLIDFADWRV